MPYRYDNFCIGASSQRNSGNRIRLANRIRIRSRMHMTSNKHISKVVIGFLFGFKFDRK